MINCFWNIPAELAVSPQWVCHNQAKVPLNVKTGKPAKTTDPTTWASFDEAVQAVANGRYAGIGFVFSDDDPYCGIDLDKCFDGDQLAPWAKDMVDALGSYTEISPSGGGLHIIVKAALPGNGKNCHKNGVQLEMYDRGRYFCMTGNHLPGTPDTIENRGEEIESLYQEFFAPTAAAAAAAAAAPASASTKGSEYGRTALEAEASKVSSAPEGSRNNTLNNAALCLGELVAGGELDESDVVARLTKAAHEAGLTGSEVKGTIRSGMEAGKKNPRTAPPTKLPPSGGKSDPKPAGDNQQVKAVLIRMSDVEPRPVEWLWPDRIAVGKMSVLAGDPGLGKSFVSLDIAARVSTGDVWPDDPYTHSPTGSTILLSAEDDPADTLRPRLDYLQADCSKIHLLDAVRRGEGPARVFDLACDLSAIENEVKAMPDCRLVIIDPISSYLGTKTDSHSNTEVRSILAPLAVMAGQYRLAVILISHLNKNQGTNPLYRAMGSLGFVAAARSFWVVTRDKPLADGSQNPRRLLLCGKSNNGPDDRGLSYIVPEGRFEWTESVNMSASAFFQGADSSKRAPARANAKQWILDALRDGPAWADDIMYMAKQEDIGLKTLKSAKQELQVFSERVGAGKGSKCYWRLPNQPKTPPRNEEE